MNKKVKILIGIVVLVCLSGIYSFVDKEENIYDSHVQTEEWIQCEEVTDENSISQSFYPKQDRLDGISLKCNLDGNVAESELIYTLFDGEGQEVAGGVISTATLKTGKFNKLKFNTIQNCKGKKFTFEIKHNKGGRSGVYFYKTVSSMRNAELRQNQSIIEGTLVMRALTHMFDWVTFVIVSCFALYIIAFIGMLYKFFR